MISFKVYTNFKAVAVDGQYAYSLKVKPEIVIVLSSEIDCWSKVPYVTVSPFWWNIQRQRELKVIRICVWRSSRWCASKDFREQMFEIISTTHNNKGSSLLTVFQRHRGFTVCDSSTLHGQDGKVYIVKSVWKVFWLYDDLLWLESLIDGWGQT